MIYSHFIELSVTLSIVKEGYENNLNWRISTTENEKVILCIFNLIVKKVVLDLLEMYNKNFVKHGKVA